MVWETTHLQVFTERSCNEFNLLAFGKRTDGDRDHE